MIERMAIFRGTVDPNSRKNFDDFVDSNMLPLISSFPGISAVEVLRPVSGDPSLEDVCLILKMSYKDVTSMDLALASPQRAANAAETETLLKMVSDPRVEHVVMSSSS